MTPLTTALKIYSQRRSASSRHAIACGLADQPMHPRKRAGPRDYNIIVTLMTLDPRIAAVNPTLFPGDTAMKAVAANNAYTQV